MTEPAIPGERVVGRWLHAHEEDGDGVTVYRPADADLPPSRGRYGLDLRADGSAAALGPGADDRPGAVAGTWSLEPGNRLVVDTGAAGGSRRALRIVAADADALYVRADGDDR